MQPLGLGLRRLARRLAQVGVPHRDALAVEAEDEQVVGDLGFEWPVGVERVKVLRGAHRQFLDLALGNAPTRAFLDQLDDLVERRLRALLGDEAPQLKRVLLVGQAEGRVERRDAAGPRRLVQQPLDLDLSDGRLDSTRRRARVSALDPVGADHLHAALPLGAPIDIALHQVAQQRGPIRREQPRHLVRGCTLGHHRHQALDEFVH